MILTDLLAALEEWGFRPPTQPLLSCTIKKSETAANIAAYSKEAGRHLRRDEARTRFYSSYGDENEPIPSDQKKIMIILGGPIGQGIDYCCVHASFALREIGIETVMVNSNPETVSTTTTPLINFTEPLTLEDISVSPRNVMVPSSSSGPTPPSSPQLQAFTLWNHPSEVAEDRKHFKAILDKITSTTIQRYAIQPRPPLSAILFC